MKKRNAKRLTLKKTAISNLEKMQISGGIAGIDTQISCYGSCLPNNTCYVGCKYEPAPMPYDPLPIPAASVLWPCP